MSEPRTPEGASFKETLREAIQSGQLTEMLGQVKAQTELGRNRLKEVEGTLESLRQLLDAARQNLSQETNPTVSEDAVNLISELARSPAFQQLAAEVVSSLLQRPPEKSSDQPK
ncbi:MAG TPA: hypothetical protein GX513_06055 [Firmicutes bacterium]|nr:hypothetical protein [Bacillota bacterium]